MGQQQLLIIILGVIVVGVAIAIGIALFTDNSVSSTKDAMATDMMHLAAKAKHYFGRPTSMGGGGHSFTGIDMNKIVTPSFANNLNATYTISRQSSDSVVFRGVGKVTYSNGDSIILELSVTGRGPSNVVVLQ
jgi:hypothetical protein